MKLIIKTIFKFYLIANNYLISNTVKELCKKII